MGDSADGILAYGYDLGGDEAEWKVREVDQYCGLTADWFRLDPETEESGEDGLDFAEEAMTRLLAEAGFTETDWEADGYFGRKRAAEEALGVEFRSYCSGDYPMYVLAARVIRVGQGHVKDIGPAMADRVPAWDEKLAAALRVLGLTPVQEKPAWLLCSYLG